MTSAREGRVFYGVLAQLGERKVRNLEVRGSIPLYSTIEKHSVFAECFFFVPNGAKRFHKKLSTFYGINSISKLDTSAAMQLPQDDTNETLPTGCVCVKKSFLFVGYFQPLAGMICP